MLEGDWVEHWVSGGAEDHGPNEDGYHATVRSQYILYKRTLFSKSFHTDCILSYGGISYWIGTRRSNLH